MQARTALLRSENDQPVFFVCFCFRYVCYPIPMSPPQYFGYLDISRPISAKLSASVLRTVKTALRLMKGVFSTILEVHISTTTTVLVTQNFLHTTHERHRTNISQRNGGGEALLTLFWWDSPYAAVRKHLVAIDRYLTPFTPLPMTPLTTFLYFGFDCVTIHQFVNQITFIDWGNFAWFDFNQCVFFEC